MHCMVRNENAPGGACRRHPESSEACKVVGSATRFSVRGHRISPTSEAGDGQSVTWSPTLRADLFLKFCRACQKTLDYGPTESSRCRLIVQSGRSLCYPFSAC